MKSIALIFLTFFLSFCSQPVDTGIRKVATWNMKWLGTNSGNQLDAVENVPLYSEYIRKTEATLFALQEIGVTHSIAGDVKCYYLDLIVDDLNEDESNGKWEYIIDSVNKQQRLAYLYLNSEWEIVADTSIRPGSSFNHIRRPYMAVINAKGENANLSFVFFNVHLKAFPDATEKRRKNFDDLAEWLSKADLDEDVLIAGDTNLYEGESDVDEALENIDYLPLLDREITSIHEYKLSQRFDRFFASPGILGEINSAKEIIGNAEYIDVIKENDENFIKWFDDNISDHFPVVLSIDVSKER